MASDSASRRAPHTARNGHAARTRVRSTARSARARSLRPRTTASVCRAEAGAAARASKDEGNDTLGSSCIAPILGKGARQRVVFELHPEGEHEDGERDEYEDPPATERERGAHGDRRLREVHGVPEAAVRALGDERDAGARFDEG